MKVLLSIRIQEHFDIGGFIQLKAISPPYGKGGLVVDSVEINKGNGGFQLLSEMRKISVGTGAAVKYYEIGERHKMKVAAGKGTAEGDVAIEKFKVRLQMNQVDSGQLACQGMKFLLNGEGPLSDIKNPIPSMNLAQSSDNVCVYNGPNYVMLKPADVTIKLPDLIQALQRVFVRPQTI